MSIRNVDSVLTPGTAYFLPEARGLVRAIRAQSSAAVIIGGTALLADADGVLGYLGADAAIVGPGDTALPALLTDMKWHAKGAPVVINAGACAGLSPGRAETPQDNQYINNDGIAGFRTHSGCSSGCSYCMEACTPVSFRAPADVINELQWLVQCGYKHLHLCDPEFNEDLEYCIGLLEGINKSALGMKWTLYMKPGNYSRKLFGLLKKTGAYLITLSVDTYEKCPEYWNDVQRMVYMARKAGIRTCIDLLTGFPGEGMKDITEAVDFFRRLAPDDVVVNTNIRLYRDLPITRVINSDPGHMELVRGDIDKDFPYLAPVFYGHVVPEKLREILPEGGPFRVAGCEDVVNYQKAI